MKSIFPADGISEINGLTELKLPLLTGIGSSLWENLVGEIMCWIKKQELISTQVTIVLPFVQLIAPLRQAWGKSQGNGWLPRFETTQTWAARLGGLRRAGAGPTGDALTDYLQAGNWLRQLEGMPATLHKMSALTQALVMPLVDMANELTATAGAYAPEHRGKYWQKAADLAQQPQPGVAAVEAALAPLAVAWAQASEGWPSDVLFQCAQNAKESYVQYGNGAKQVQALIVLQAGGVDALTKNLYEAWPKAWRLWLNLDYVQPKATPLDNGFNDQQQDLLFQIAQLHPPHYMVAQDAEDEAQCAAAQVIDLLNRGIVPVALCTQDRPTARRVWALLRRQQIPMADETGWTLSTTRSAAMVMSIIRSAMWNASSDMVLDALKALPEKSDFVLGLDILEGLLRQMEQPNWPSQAPAFWPPEAKAISMRVNAVIAVLATRSRKSLWSHLQALHEALRLSTASVALQRDEAGREVLQTLQFYSLKREAAEGLFTQDDYFAVTAKKAVMDYAEFMRWVTHALESVTFIPQSPVSPQVIFTPLARLMLRPFAAVVIPGCDDSRLTHQPKFAGVWCERDRLALDLPNRQRWWQRLVAQWIQALRLPQVYLFWRKAEGSEPLGPASLVQSVVDHTTTIQGQTSTHLSTGVSIRRVRSVTPKPTLMPAPRPQKQLPLNALSASAYQKLRDCPYKFYAEHLLALREKNELEEGMDKRDYGNWVHAVLSDFHERRLMYAASISVQKDALLLDMCATEQARLYDEAAFIPWAARWPITARAYLQWLHQYEALGARFERSEVAMQYQLTPEIMLQGRIDRMDRQDGIPILIDYKTESLVRTQMRVKEDLEDVQLPFYTLLTQGEVLSGKDKGQNIANAQAARAFYLSLDGTVLRKFELDNIEHAKHALRAGIEDDINRLLYQGYSSCPIGQAPTCTYCPVNGLCRKAYWDNQNLDNNDVQNRA